MRIVEQSVIGKQSQETCEDGIALNSNFAAVIDGSTSKTSMRINPIMSNGRYCMTLVRDVINEMPANADIYQFCDLVTKRIKSIYETHKINIEQLESHPERRLTASAVVYSSFLNQVWFIGDCQCLVDDKLYNFSKPSEKELAEERADILNKAISQGETTERDVMNGVDYGRESIVPQLIESCKMQNISFPVIDGFQIPLDLIHIINLPKDAKQLVLASDGYPQLCPTLLDSENTLQRILKEDPLCIKVFKATKGLRQGYSSFDDRSYIRMKF